MKLQLSNGTNLILDDSLTDDEAMQLWDFVEDQLKSELADKEQPVEAPVEQTLGQPVAETPESETGDFSRGFQIAYKQLPQLGYGLEAGALAAGESILGEGGKLTELKKESVAKYEEAGNEIQATSKPTDSPTYSFEKAMEGDYGSLVDTLQYGLGYGVGQISQSGVASFAGKFVGKAVARATAENIAEKMVAEETAKWEAKVATGILTEEQLKSLGTQTVAKKMGDIGSKVALGSQAFGMEAGEIGGDLANQSVDENRTLTTGEVVKGLGSAIAATALEYGADRFTLGALMGRGSLSDVGQYTTGIKGKLVRGAALGLSAGGVELGTEFLQTGIEQYGEGKDILSNDSLREDIDSAILGSIGGHAVGVTGGMLSSAKQKPNTVNPEGTPIAESMLQGGLPTATAQPVNTNLDDYNNIFSDENLNRRSNAPIVDNETVAADIMASDDPIATFNDVVEANTFGNEINMDYANKVADRFIGKKEIEISDKDYQDAVQLEHQLSTVRDEIAYRKFQEMYSQNKRDDLNDLIAQEVAEKQQQLAQILEQQRNNRVEKSIPSINKTIENEQWGKTRNNRNTVIQMVFDKNVPAENIFPAIKAELKRQGFRDTEINQDDIDAYNLLKTSPTTPVAKAPEVILSSENEMNVAGLIKEKAQPVALDQTLPALEKVNEWVNNGAKYKNGMLIDNNGKKFLLNKAQREHYANLVTPIVADDTPVATTEETPFTPTQLVDDTVFSEESVLTPQVQSAQQEKASAKEIYKNEKGDNNGEYYYGMVKEVTKIMPNELKPLSQTEINGAISSQRYSELTPEEWAKTIDLSKPIDATIYGDGEIKIQDGHHRYLAAKILNKPLSVEFRSINAKNNILNDAIYRINKGVEDYQSNNVDTSDTNPNVPLDSAQQTPELKKDGTPFAKASAANLIINSKHRTDLSNDTHEAVELPTGGFGIVAKAPTAATAKSVKNSADNLASSFPEQNQQPIAQTSSESVEVSRGTVEQPVEKAPENKQVDDNVSKVDEKIDTSAQPEKESTPEMQAAKDKAAEALRELGDIFLDANLFAPKAVPVKLDSARLLPVLSKLMSAYIEMGHITFKDNARTVLAVIREKFGDASADSLSMANFRAAYNNTEQGATPEEEVILFKTFDMLEDDTVEAETTVNTETNKTDSTVGNTVTIATPSNEKQFDAQYEVAEIGDVTASHDMNNRANDKFNDDKLQGRDRTHVDYEVKTLDQIKNFNPQFLGASVASDDGAPIITNSTSKVISGNGRHILLSRLYSRFPDKAAQYKQWLIDNAKQFGLSPDVIAKMDKPILVRRKSNDDDLELIADKSNVSGMAEMSALDRAFSDARQVSESVFLQFKGGELESFANQPFVQAFNEALGLGGSLTLTSLNRMKNAIMAHAYGDYGSAKGRAIVEGVSEELNPDAKSILNALYDSSSEWVLLRAAFVATGTKDFTSNLVDAVHLIRDAKARGKLVKDVVDQYDMETMSSTDPFTRQFVQLFFKDTNMKTMMAQKDIAAILKDVATEMTKQISNWDMFDDAKPLTPQQILENAYARYKGTKSQPKGQVGLFDAGFSPYAKRGDKQREAESRKAESGQGTDSTGVKDEGREVTAKDFARKSLAEQYKLVELDESTEAVKRFVDMQQRQFKRDGVMVDKIDKNKILTRVLSGQFKRDSELWKAANDVQKQIKDSGYVIKKIGGAFKESVITSDSIFDILTKGNTNVPSTNTDLERNSGVTNSANERNETPVFDGSTGDADLLGQSSEPAKSAENVANSDKLDSISVALTGGESSDNQLLDGNETNGIASSVARDSDSGRSGEDSLNGMDVRRDGSNPVKELPAKSVKGLKPKQVTHVEADLENVKEAMPFLNEGQADDVVFAEKRFEEHKGVLFANGTGTGKTFSGLGIVSRFANQGKNNILIVAPSQNILDSWTKAAKNFFGLEVSLLEDKNDAGKGIVATTYANFGDNVALVNREWDLIVTDEAHYLMSNSAGTNTASLEKLRGLTGHESGFSAWFNAKHSELRDKINEQKQLKESKSSDYDEALHDKLDKELHDYAASEREEWKTKESKTKTVMLSATPFAYESNIDFANGYLFDYDKVDGSGYNAGGGKERFFMQHLGYRMRYNKLTQPDAKVDRSTMQRQFNEMLKKTGALSARSLDVPFDYDRQFILTESAIGQRIDEALQWLSDNEARELSTKINETFDYLTRRYLLEAIKAKEIIPVVKEHLAAGRKVLVFHDYKKGGANNPFKLNIEYKGWTKTGTTDYDNENPENKLWEQNEEFKRAFPDLTSGSALEGMQLSPIEHFENEFGKDALIYNGDVSSKERIARVAQFNDDNSGKNLILLQSASAKEGVSFHDTTGVHQRVLINIGLPTAPTTAIQQEGRIYRVGQKSDAIFRYVNTGTNWERWAFASTIAGRASAAENLALGEGARGLRDAFINAFENSDSYPVGHEGEGKGGKDSDKQAYRQITEMDRAKGFYYATQKKNSRTKSAEGTDYFATPEPVGLVMTRLADAREGEKMLEPSAGHGAIARWFRTDAERTAIEPSSELNSRLALVFQDGDIKRQTFEDLNIVNKYDAIVMNPPFGTGGKTAIEHLEKAFNHLRDGGRVVALIPEGAMADKRLDAWVNGESRELLGRDEKLGEIYKGDILTRKNSNDENGKPIQWEITGNAKDMSLKLKSADGKRGSLSFVRDIISIKKPQTEKTDAKLVYDISLPTVTFERAGTKVKTHIVVIEKTSSNITTENVDLSDIDDINQLFDRLDALSIDERVKPVEEVAEKESAPIASNTTETVGTLVEGKHTKTGEAIFTVQLPARVERDTYTKWAAAAKQMGGGWSRFTNGFLFKSKDAANKFMDYLSSSDTSDVKLSTNSEAAPTNTHTTASFMSAAKSILDNMNGKGWFDGLWGTGSFETISNAEALRIVGENSKFHKAWHGSPYTFDKFDLSKLGTGTGEQVFGYGLYFAENKGTAEQYKRMSANVATITIDGKEVRQQFSGINKDDLIEFLENSVSGYKKLGDERSNPVNKQNAYDKSNLFQTMLDAVNKGDFELDAIGALYEVEIPYTQDDYIEWNKNVDLTNDNLEEAVYNFGIPKENLTGEKLYRALSEKLGSDKRASELLFDVGIKGIKFSDNYVIFSDKDITIEAKYSKDGKIEAFYNPADDKVYFVPENISKERSLKGLFLHEVGTHMMRLGLNQEELNAIFSDVESKRESNPLVKAAYKEALRAGTKAQDLNEETLARVIDKHPELKLSQRFMAWFKKAVRNFAKRYKGADKLAFIKWANKLDEKDWVYMATIALRSAPSDVVLKGNSFNPNQIKSAIGNTGAFDSSNNDIRFSKSQDRRISESERLNVSSEIKKLTDKFEKGEITQDKLLQTLAVLHGKLESNKDDKAILSAQKQRVRGADYIRQRLLEAKRRGDITSETADIAEWFVLKNEALFDDLGISIKASDASQSENANAVGYYDAMRRIITLIKGSANDTTAVHEMLHHLEKMMPDNLQNDIRKEWMRHVLGARKKATDTQEIKYLEAVIAGDQSRAMDILKGIPDNNQTLYRLLNSSEFWAVNGSDALMARFKSKGGFMLRVANWLKEFSNHVKSAFGFATNSPVIKTLDDLLKNTNPISPNGRSMLSDEGVLFADVSKSNNESQGRFNIPNETSFRSFRKWVQDDLLRIRIVMDRVKEQGGIINESNDVALAMEAAGNIAANQLEKLKERHIQPLFDRMAKMKVNQDEIGLLLYAKSAPDRNAYIQSINAKFRELGEGGSGMTDAESAAIIERYKETMGDKYAEFEKLTDDWQNIQNMVKNILVASGDISPEQAQEWDNSTDYHVPLKGFEEIDEETGNKAKKSSRGNIGQGFSISGKFDRKMLGRQSRASNIVANIVQNLERAVIRSSKIYVQSTLYNLIKDNPDVDLWEAGVIPMQPIMGKAKAQYVMTFHGSEIGQRDTLRDARRYVEAETERTGQSKKEYKIVKVGGNPQVTLMKKPYDQNTEISYWKNGKQVRITVNDEAFVQAFNRLGDENIYSMFKVMAAFNRFLRHAYTVLSPAFIIANGVMVDPAVGLYTNTGRYGFKYAAIVLAKTPMASLQIAKYMATGSTNNTKWNDAIKLYLDNGGKSGTAFISSIENKADELNLAVLKSRMQNTNFYEYPLDRLKLLVVENKLVNFLKYLGDVSETATRLATFKVAMDDGKSAQQAAKIARNVTINFNRHGIVGRELGALYLFLNASIQGTENLIDTAVRGEHKVQATALLATYVSIGYLIALLGGDDGDDDLISESEKTRFISVTLDEEKGIRANWKMAYGLSFFKDLGTAIARIQLGGDTEKIMNKLMSSFFNNFSYVNPMVSGEWDNRDLISGAIPTITSIPYSIYNNRNRWGKPIYPENVYDTSIPDSEKEWANTRGTLFSDFAKWMNKVTGGTKVEAGLIDVSPESMKYTLNALTGSIGTQSYKFVNSIYTSSINSTEMSVDKLPVVSSFVKETGIDAYRQVYNSQRKEAKEIYDKFKKYEKLDDEAAKDKFEARHQPMLDFYDDTTSIIKRVKLLRTKQDDARLEGDRVLLKELESDEKELLIDYNAQYNQRQ